VSAQALVKTGPADMKGHCKVSGVSLSRSWTSLW